MSVDDLDFMQKIRDAFISRQSNQFLLTGNVLDVYRCPWTEPTSADAHYIALTDYLTQRLSRKRRLIITYNIARGIEFESSAAQCEALSCYLTLFGPQEQTIGRDSFNEVMSRSSAYILPSLVLMQKLCKAAAANSELEFAIIVEHFESILPDKPLAQMSDIDRQRLVFFREWLTDTTFLASQHVLIFISETASAVNPSVRALPHMINIHLPLPDDHERRLFIRWCKSTLPKLRFKSRQQVFCELSAGMTLLGIEQIMKMAFYKRGRLERDDFMRHLNRLLMARIGDHIEIIRPRHSLSDVIGNTALKAQLERLGATLRTGKPDIAPVGILVSGPNGVGKTFVIMAWAHACERTVIVLKNLRSSFFGETDQIFEKIRNVLEVLGNVIVVVDEADTVFARPGANTHETEQRLFGNVITMMGDPRNRAKIVWVLMTSRPDNLAPDLKRSGRCGLHLPIFDPEGDDREAFVDYVMAECGLKRSAFTKRERAGFDAAIASFSPADFRELIVELKTEREIQNGTLSPSAVLTVIEECLAGSLERQRRVQTLQALLHCSRRSLIAPSLVALTRDDIYAELQALENS